MAVLTARVAMAEPGQESLHRPRQINEIAASLLEVHLDLKDATATLPQPETPTARTKRLLGDAEVMDRADQALKPLHTPSSLVHQDAENVKRWDQIHAAARQLRVEIAGYRKRVQSQVPSQIINTVLTDLRRAIWNIYADLRDALP
jgi:hypothetical protein